MYLMILFGQRKERYAGEYAPEALEVVDEWALEQGDSILADRRSKHVSDTSFESVEWFRVDLPSGSFEAIRKRLTGFEALVASGVTAADGGSA